MHTYTIYCDGSVLPHRQGKPSFAAFAACRGNTVVAEWSGRVEAVDVTAAELQAVLEALQWAAGRRAKGVQVFTDSKAAVLTIQGRRLEKYVEILWQIRALIKTLKASVNWVPREMNAYADGLCRKAARKYQQ
ncbi:MAG: reverse transcriptase-like protein [Pelotomaculum sp.]|nr:reverse transcriptase-like protein [Pelotomaculum sp.]